MNNNTINKNTAMAGTGSLFIILCSFFLITACDTFFRPNWHFNEGSADVHITIGGNARTILPSQFELEKLYYVLTFTHDDFDDVSLRLNETTSGTVHLALGLWNMQVYGYVDDPGDNPTPASALVMGSQIINVGPVNNSVTVQLSLNTLSQRGSGTLRYAITLPSEANGTLEVYEVSVSGGVLVQDSNPVLAEDLQEGLNEGEEEDLPSGFYRIIVQVERGNFAATWQEIAHVYDRAITIAEKTFEVSDIRNPLTGAINEFNFAEIPLAGVHIEALEIHVTVPEGTIVTSLTALITHNGVFILPAPGLAMDYTNPVAFTVYTGDEDANEYTVTVEVVVKSDFGSLINEAKDEESAVQYTSTNPREVPHGVKFVIPSDRTLFTNAIAAAEIVLADPMARRTDVVAAMTVLNAARDAFEAALLDGAKPDMTALNAEIARAEEAKAGVRQDSNGTNVPVAMYWVTDTVMADFNTAIASAKLVSTDPQDVIIQSEADDAREVLTDAITAFNSARQLGTNPDIPSTQRVVRITGIPSNYSGAVMTGIYKSRALHPLTLTSTPAFGEGTIANDEIIFFMVISYIGPPLQPWLEGDPQVDSDGWYIGLWLMEDDTYWVSSPMHYFDDDPYPTISFSEFEEVVDFDNIVSVGELIEILSQGSLDGGSAQEHLRRNYGSNVTMEAFLSEWKKQGDDQMLEWEDLMAFLNDLGIILYKDPGLTDPFVRTDIVNVDTIIYCETSFYIHPEVHSSIREGSIAQIYGTINLQDIPDGALIYIQAKGEAGGQSWQSGTQYNRILGIPRGTGSMTNIPWSIFITEGNSPDFNASWDMTFSLIVNGDTREIQVRGDQTITFSGDHNDGYTANAGILGANLGYVAIEGTIDVLFDGIPVPWLRITAQNGEDGPVIGRTSFAAGVQKSPWSIPIPISNTVFTVEFLVEGFPDNTLNENNRLFRSNIPNVNGTYNFEGLHGISNVNFVSLSGTIDINYNGDPVSDVTINLGAWDPILYRNLNGYTDITPTGTTIPYTIIVPESDPNTNWEYIDLLVRGNTQDGQAFDTGYSFGFFTLEQNEIPANASKIKNFELALVDLSGSIDISYDGAAVPWLGIMAHITGSGPSYMGDISFSPGGHNFTNWSMIIPASHTDRTVSLSVSGFTGSNQQNSLFHSQVNDFYTIPANAGLAGVHLVSVTGTINMINNDSVVSHINIHLNAYAAGYTELRVMTFINPNRITNIPLTMVIPANSIVWLSANLHLNGSMENGGYFSEMDHDLNQAIFTTNTSVSGFNFEFVFGTFDVFTNLDDIADYLNSLVYSDWDSPHPLVVDIDLGDMSGSNEVWQNLSEVIWNAGKYVHLDLSACAMSGTNPIFNPFIPDYYGQFISSLTLPDSARVVEGFGENFRSLRHVSGAMITTIEENAFMDCSSLMSAYFPAVTSIGVYAFIYCNNLESVTLGTLSQDDFNPDAFPGSSLRNVYFSASGGAGTYIRDPWFWDWEKQ